MPASLAPFGTAHEELEDEKNTAVSRRPKRIEDEIATDEKGRRRFHGAFTGGFSAGYFNTAGSKEGWEPKTFKSTRGERNERVNFTAEDFMDSEDRGEYGFAHRQIRARNDFLEQVTDTGDARGPAPLAWERSVPSTSTADFSDIAAHLEKTILPVNDSIGVRILKKMGWRPGKGIGPRMKRRALERQKVIDARSRGESSRFDEKAVRDVEENAPDVEFFPDDIPRLFFEPNNATHGIGYRPLEHSSALDETFAFKVDALKTKKNSRGIRGQAFGVGAFEDEDDDIYTSMDLSKYDFAIGGESSSTVREIERYDSKFVPAEKPERPVYYKAPQPTRHFNARHTPQPITLKDLPQALLSAVDHLTPLQRAVFLGDRSGSVLELLNDADRKKLELLSRKSEKETTTKAPERRPEKRAEAEPFEEEPLKAHRFKKYIHYLKSGYEMPPPMEMTRLEWEREQTEFENFLTPELRALLPSVRSRQEPLANLKTAQPIADLLKSRFQVETNTDESKPESKLDNDRKQAVALKQFGLLTRTKYKWQPSKLLCKYFNVEDPFPGSQLVGTLELQKRAPATNVQFDSIGNLGLPNTQRDVIDRMEREAHSRRRTRFDAPDTRPETSEVRDEKRRETKLVEKPVFLPPLELLQSVFELPSLDESSSSESEAEEPQKPAAIVRTEKPAEKPTEKFITILDLVPDDDEYGPKIPETLPAAPPPEEKAKFVPVAPEPEIVQIDSTDESSADSENRRPSKKRRRTEERRKKVKKEKKHKSSKAKSSKKSKKHKKRRASDSDA